MVVTHNNQQYKVKPVANGSLWRLTSADSPREGIVLTSRQMAVAGFGELVSNREINLNRVMAAENKIVIAMFLEDNLMWHQAVQELHMASGGFA